MNNDISKKTMILLYSIIFVPLLIGIFVVIYINCSDKTTPQEYALNDQKSINVHSHIISIYRDKNNHNVQTLKFSDTSFTIPPDWEDKFKIGDSISKDKGSLKMGHYTNGVLKEILDYNAVFKTWRE